MDEQCLFTLKGHRTYITSAPRSSSVRDFGGTVVLFGSGGRLLVILPVGPSLCFKGQGWVLPKTGEVSVPISGHLTPNSALSSSSSSLLLGMGRDGHPGVGSD